MAKDKNLRSRPLFPNSKLSLSKTRKLTTDSAVTSKGRKVSVKQLDNHSTPHTPKKQSAVTTNRPTVTENQRKKDSSNKTVPPMKYESELERTLRLKMEKLKESHKKLSKSSNTLSESSLRQRLASQQTSNGTSSTSLSQSKLKVKIPSPMNGIKVNKPHVNSSMLPKQKTVNIWKFSDGTTVKKVY